MIVNWDFGHVDFLSGSEDRHLSFNKRILLGFKVYIIKCINLLLEIGYYVILIFDYYVINDYHDIFKNVSASKCIHEILPDKKLSNVTSVQKLTDSFLLPQTPL